jgi:hypothetical protein
VGDGTRASVCAERDKPEFGLGYLDGSARAIALHPGFDMNIDRGFADSLDLGVNTEYVADFDRADKTHTVERDRNGAALRAFGCANTTRYIHLRQYPAAEDISGGV